MAALHHCTAYAGIAYVFALVLIKIVIVIQSLAAQAIDRHVL